MIFVQIIIRISLILYGFSLFFPLFTMKNQKTANIGSNVLTAAAGLLGMVGSLLYLLYYNAKLSIINIDSSWSFIVINSELDRLSAFFVLILSIVAFATAVYSIGYIGEYYGKRNTVLLNCLMSTFILSLFFVFTASNAIWFFIAWEAMSVISYFIVVFESDNEENQKAGKLYIIMTLAGTAFLIINFMLMISYTGSFRMDMSSSSIPSGIKNLMFIFFLIGFGTKAGVVPLHIWLPKAHPAAPSNGSAFMSGVMIKTAVYGMIRFVLMYLGVEHTWWGITVMTVGMITVFVGISYAFIEKNIKKLLAYSSIENIGIIFIALGISFIGYSKGDQTICALGLMAVLVHSFNHSLFKSGLFLGAGSIQYATHTKNMEELGGLAKKMPVSAVLFLGAALSISAVVPFNGFIGEWITYQALIKNIVIGDINVDLVTMLSIAVLAFAGALALATFVKAYGISFLGLPRTEHSEHAKEVPKAMNAGIGLLVGLCLVIGILPMTLIGIADKIVESIVGQSLIGDMSGKFFVATYPLTLGANSISPLAGVIVLAAVGLIAMMILKFYGGKTIERKYETWGCGYQSLNSRMQYTSGGYSKTLSIIFRFLFRPTRKLKQKGLYKYHPEEMEYVITMEPVFEKYLYEPLSRLIRGLSTLAKLKIQTGSIHAYLIYIFVAVLILMLYNRLV
ncbi:MAG: formate hydrogenlyase [Peptostreptococcaceae bacterium]|nr:formate hydrogenlyase [Peptostreptococcaceae bacterium]